VIALFTVVASLLATQTPVSDSLRTERLATLGRLWYAARLFHPYLAYRPIDWDSALVAAIPHVSSAKSRDEYATAVSDMLSALGDPATHIESAPTPGAPSTGEPDPRSRWTDDSILVITATNYADLADWSRSVARFDSIAQLVPRARAIVFDLRQRVRGPSGGWLPFEFSQSTLLPLLFAAPLAGPGSRTRVHAGYRGDAFGPSGSGYWSAWINQDGDLYKGPPGAVWRPAAFVVNDYSEVPGAALALQGGGHARLIVEGAPSDASLVSTTALQMGEGLNVRLRLSEIVFADGTGGLPADTVVSASSGTAVSDAALEAALGMLRHPGAASHARAPQSPVAAPPPQRDYAEMRYPTMPYRLLAAFRIWGTFEYFHAYRQLYDEDWTGVLKQFIPKFEAARDSVEYALTVREMLTHTRDNHVGASSPVLDAYFGDARAPLLVRLIEGVPVVTGFPNDSAASVAHAAGVAIGDVIVRVDSEPALSDTFTVTTAGTVALPTPVNHEIPLRGVLRSELQGYLAQQLSQYLRNPALRARALVRVSVQGGVVRPGYYAVPADALVADALMAAGGTLPTAKPGKMQLERGGARLLDGKELAQAIAQGRTLDDLNVQDGDQLVIPKEGAGMGDNLRFLWVVVSITGGIVGLTKVFGH
jgi:protein involved in polysaccharide export with SLBB domain